MTALIISNLWLIPVTPLVASLVILALPNSQRKAGAALAIFGQVIGFILALTAFCQTLGEPGYRAFHNFTWFTFGAQALRVELWRVLCS